MTSRRHTPSRTIRPCLAGDPLMPSGPEHTPTPGVAFITGGGSGIGLQTARLLAEEGFALALFDRNAQAASDAAGELGGAGAPAIGLSGDVSSAADVAQAADSAAGLGRIAAVVACAGIDTVGEVDQLEENAWERCIAV